MLNAKLQCTKKPSGTRNRLFVPDGFLYDFQIKFELSEKLRQGTLRSLTTFHKTAPPLEERWAIAQTYLRDFIPQTPYYASR